MEKITYKEAAKILGVSVGTLKHAIGREVLTQVPTKGQIKYLLKDQVDLFKGKSRLSFNALDKDEKKSLELFKQVAIAPPNPQGPSVRDMLVEQEVEKIAQKGYVKGAEDLARRLYPAIARLVQMIKNANPDLVTDELERLMANPY